MDSILTDYDICVICGRPKECTHHLIPGTAKRNLCEADGLKIPLCNNHHNMAGKESIHGTEVAEHMGRIAAQLAWEKRYIIEHGYDGQEREQFRRRYGKSYL